MSQFMTKFAAGAILASVLAVGSAQAAPASGVAPQSDSLVQNVARVCNAYGYCVNRYNGYGYRARPVYRQQYYRPAYRPYYQPYYRQPLVQVGPLGIF